MGDCYVVHQSSSFTSLYGILNTFHQEACSILFDVKSEALVDFILDIQEVLLRTDKYFEETFGVPLALKLKAGASYGKDWYNMIEVEL